MNVLDLFSGIGGFSLGLERAGMRTVQFVEIDPFCRRVLAKHWPAIPCHDDIRTYHAVPGSADVVCGGFPCQDISEAGKGAGLAGERSGLWSEYARLVGEVRPSYVIVENVSALLGRGIDVVLGDLAALGFDAEWHCIPASAIGARHQRDRVWIVAYADRGRWWADSSDRHDAHGPDAGRSQADRVPGAICGSGRTRDLADSPRNGLEEQRLSAQRVGMVADFIGRCWISQDPQWPGGDVWEVEPSVGRVAHGIPDRVDRIAALGNAIVPQIAEIIGQAIMKSSGLNQKVKPPCGE